MPIIILAKSEQNFIISGQKFPIVGNKNIAIQSGYVKPDKIKVSFVPNFLLIGAANIAVTAKLR